MGVSCIIGSPHRFSCFMAVDGRNDRSLLPVTSQAAVCVMLKERRFSEEDSYE